MTECLGNIIQRPENIVVTARNTTTFKCGIDKTEKGIDWYYSESITGTSGSERLIFSGDAQNQSFGKRFSVNIYSGYSELKIDNTDISDAGVYKCEETGSHISSSAELIVIGKTKPPS